MKIIQILITGLALLYAHMKGYGQTEKDSVKIEYKGKTYKIETSIEPGEEERNRTLKFMDTVKKTTVLVTVSSRKSEGKEWSDKKDDSTESAMLQKKIVKLMKKEDSEARKHFIETSFLPTFDIGFAGTMTENGNAETRAPKIGKSANINIGIVGLDMNLYKGRVLLSSGVNLNNYYLKYNNKQVLQYIDDQGLLKSYVDSVNNYDKNRQDVRYITVPVLLEYHSKQNKFSIAAGVEFGFNGNTKLTLKGDRESLDFKHKTANNIKINTEQVNAVLRIGIKDFCIYGRYTITDMYQASAHKGPANPVIPYTNPYQHLFSVGVCLFGI